MVTLTVYCKNHKRKPIRYGHISLFRDRQADIPIGWCCLCGSEVFEIHNDLCVRCCNLKGENR